MRRLRAKGIYALVALLAWPTAAMAVTPGDPSSSSTNYQIVEGEIGGSGQYDATSTNFNVKPTQGDGGSNLGGTAVGNSASANFQTNSGFNTTSNPALSFTVNTPSINLGTLSTSAATTATATFKVLNYTSYGYAVTMVGTPPSNSGHPLTPLATDTASANGFEQFGVNTVANTSPGTVGANPVQDVSGSTTFGFGRAGTGAGTPYAQTNLYRYGAGETIASAPKSSGITNYTLTVLVNIATLTPGGRYTGPMTLICTGTY